MELPNRPVVLQGLLGVASWRDVRTPRAIPNDLRRLATWLNRNLQIVATDEESAYYANVDRELDALESLAEAARSRHR